MHAYVHRETCIQCGLCPGVCPEVFSILPGESAQAITEPVPQEYLAAAQEAFMPDVRPLDLNTATAEELMALPGIGEELSRRILEYRETHGPFAAVEELMEVSGIGEAKLAALEGRVTVNGE